MTEPDSKAVACALGGGELQARLARIAALGGRGLVSRQTSGGTSTLRFRDEERTRRELEEIVAAEARCCPFLELSIGDRDGDLVLTIAAPAGAEATGEALAIAFSGADAPSSAAP